MRIPFLKSRVHMTPTLEEDALRGLEAAELLTKRQALLTGQNEHWELYHQMRSANNDFKDSDVHTTVTWQQRVKTGLEIEREIERIK